MQILERRQAAYGAASVASVLFFALFFGVYAPLLGGEVPTVQLTSFFAVPVFAAGAMLYAARDHDWAEVVLEETSADLGWVAGELEQTRDAFESGIDAQFGGIDALQSVAPQGVAGLQKGAQDYRERLDEFEAEIDVLRRIEDPKKARRRATDLRERVNSLDPDERLEEIDGEFQRRLTSGVRTEYGTVRCESRFGEPYSLVNLPTRFREVELSAKADPVHIDHLGETLVDCVADAESYADVADSVEAVEEHLGNIRTFLQEQERTIATDIESAKSTLETVRDQVEGLEAGFESRVHDVLIEGRAEAVTGVCEIESTIERACSALQDCRFDEATASAAEARSDASSLVSAAEFVSSLAVSIEHTHRSVSIPEDVDLAFVRSVVPAIESALDNVRLEVAEADHAVTLMYNSTSVNTTRSGTSGSEMTAEQVAADGSDTRATSASTTTAHERVSPPEMVVDEVLYALREFHDTTDDDEAIVQYSLENLPDSIARRDALVNLRRFAERQSDLFADVDLQSPEPPGFIEFAPIEGVGAKRAIEETRERFREKYT